MLGRPERRSTWQQGATYSDRLSRRRLLFGTPTKTIDFYKCVLGVEELMPFLIVLG